MASLFINQVRISACVACALSWPEFALCTKSCRQHDVCDYLFTGCSNTMVIATTRRSQAMIGWLFLSICCFMVAVSWTRETARRKIAALRDGACASQVGMNTTARFRRIFACGVTIMGLTSLGVFCTMFENAHLHTTPGSTSPDEIQVCSKLVYGHPNHLCGLCGATQGGRISMGCPLITIPRSDWDEVVARRVEAVATSSQLES